MKQLLDCGCYYVDPQLTLCPTHNKPLIFGFGSTLYGRGKPMHTPEDWKWEKVEGPGLVTEHTLKGPDVLCRYWGDNPPTAHARLIAAAPAMKEACKLTIEAVQEAVSQLNDKGIACPAVLGLLSDKIRQLIALAEKEVT